MRRAQRPEVARTLHNLSDTTKHAAAGVSGTAAAAIGTALHRSTAAVRGAVGDTLEVVIDRAHSSSEERQERLAGAMGSLAEQSRRARRKAIKVAKRRARKAQNSALKARVSAAASAGDLRNSARSTALSSTRALRSSARDARDTARALTRRGAEQEQTSRRDRMRAASSLFDGTGDRGAEPVRRQKKRRWATAVKVALLLALAGAAAAAVRALRPSSSGTGAAIPPKMRPVPNSRLASPRSASGGPADASAGTDPVLAPATALDSVAEPDAEPITAVFDADPGSVHDEPFTSSDAAPLTADPLNAEPIAAVFDADPLDADPFDADPGSMHDEPSTSSDAAPSAPAHPIPTDAVPRPPAHATDEQDKLIYTSETPPPAHGSQ